MVLAPAQVVLQGVGCTDGAHLVSVALDITFAVKYL